jgi:hypothetical protein
MARKIVIHLDALVVIALAGAASVGFIAYQRHQYASLLQEFTQVKLGQFGLELETARLQALAARCPPPAAADAVRKP